MVTVIKNSIVKQKMEKFYTCSNPLDNQKSMLQKRRSILHTTNCFLKKIAGKTKTIALNIPPKGWASERTLFKWIKSKTTHSLRLSVSKSRNCFKSEASFVLVAHTCQIFLAKLIFQLSLFDGALGTVAFSFRVCTSFTKWHNARKTDDFTVKMLVSIKLFVQLLLR